MLARFLKSLLVFACVILAFWLPDSTLQAQEAPYLGTTWTYTEYFKMGFGEPVRRESPSDIVLVDTTRKAGKLFYEMERDGSGCEAIQTNYIRYSTDGMQMYYWSDIDSAEFLLYDFSLTEGDTMHLYCNEYKGWSRDTIQKFIVDSVVLENDYNGNSHRVQYLSVSSEANTDYIAEGFFRVVEGVGSDYYLFPFVPVCDYPEIYNLRCYSNTSKNLKLVDHDCEAVINSISEAEAMANPWIESIQNGVLTLTQPVQGNIVVTSLQGQQFYRKELKGELFTQFPIRDWPAGMYVIQIQKRSGYIQQVKYLLD